MTPSTTIAQEQLRASQNGTAQNQPPPSAIEQLLKANTQFAVWLIFLAIGGGLLALYYAHIGYLPDIEWKAALIYLFIGSIVGGVIGLLLTLSLYLPGVIWSESIVFDRCLDFFYPPPEKQADEQTTRELCIQTIFGYLGFPFLLVLLLSHIALLAGNTGYWVFAIGLLWVTFVVMRILFRYRLLPDNDATCLTHRPWGYLWSNLIRGTKWKNSSVDITTIDRHAFKLSSSFTLSVLLNQISMYLIYRLSGSPTKFWTFVALTLICTGGVWVAAHVIALRHQQQPRQAIFAALVGAGLLLFTADNFSKLSVQLLSNFGIGYYEKVNVLVNEHGSQILGGLGVAKCGTDKLYNVEILSKLGDDYYLKIADNTYITLPKKDVVAISR
jgi:hypothetical protein